MTLSTVPFGTEIVAEHLVASGSLAYTGEKLVTVHDLLMALNEHPPSEYPMLRSTAARLSEFYGRPTEEIKLDLLPEDIDGFRDHLTGLRYKKNSVRSYVNFAHRLIASAKELGWEPAPPCLPAGWDPLLTDATEAGCRRLLRYLANKGLSPAAVEQADLDEWVQIEVKRGASYLKAQGRATRMRRIIVRGGFTSKLEVNKVQKAAYGIPMEKFPETLRAEIEEVLRWKQDRFVPSRPKKAKVRPVTARCLEGVFSRLYGFVVNVEDIAPITTIRELVTERNVGRYISWCLNERKIKGKGLLLSLASLRAALSKNPKFADVTGDWMDGLLDSIPEDEEGEAIKRKEDKYLPYAQLAGIPRLMREARNRIARDNPKALALSVRDELLLQWLLVLPWRQRNLRECRIGGRNPNLFRGVLGKMSSVAKPGWLLKLEEERGPTEVWQIRFVPDETKTGNDVHCVLPEPLVSLLEEYLTVHRPYLIREADPGTLFVNEHGKPMAASQIRNVLSRLTLKYGGRRVNPHLFRDIFAYMWLELAPEDYLTLSKLLWHRNIQTTIRIYGRKFNESTALCRMERLLFSKEIQ
jgi:integrase